MGFYDEFKQKFEEESEKKQHINAESESFHNSVGEALREIQQEFEKNGEKFTPRNAAGVTTNWTVTYNDALIVVFNSMVKEEYKKTNDLLSAVKSVVLSQLESMR